MRIAVRDDRTVGALTPARWALAAAVVVCCLAASFGRWAYLADVERIAADFGSYVVTAQVIRDGDADQIYVIEPATPAYAEALNRARKELALADADVITPYLYPPIFAKLLAILPWTTWRGLWQAWLAVMTASLWAGFFLSFRLVKDLSIEVAAVLAALASIFLECSGHCIWLGQVTPIMFLLTTGAIFAFERGKATAAGALVGVAVFLKLTPIVLVVPWLVHRFRPTLAGFVAGAGIPAAISLLVMGGPLHVTYAHKVGEALGWSLASFNTHSISSFVARRFATPDEILHWTPQHLPPGARLFVSCTTLALVAIFAFITFRSMKARNARLATAAAILLTLAIPTFSWTHYAVALVPAALLVYPEVRRAVPPVPLAVAVVGLVLFLAKPLQPANPPTLGDRLLMDGYTGIYVLGLVAIALLANRRSGAAADA